MALCSVLLVLQLDFSFPEVDREGPDIMILTSLTIPHSLNGSLHLRDSLIVVLLKATSRTY